MSKTLVAVLATVGLLVLFVAGMVLGYFSFTNTANRTENGIKAQYSENQNVFDNGYKKVVEASQITDKQADDLKALYLAVAEGLKSPTLLMQSLGAFNPQMDQSTYRQIQQMVEAYHNSFQQRQSELISRKNEYDNYLNATFTGRIYNNFAGYPHIDLAKYDIVTSQRTSDAFETKKSGPLEIYKRPAPKQ